MKPPESQIKPASPDDWLRHAESDLEMARRALVGDEMLYDQACFHAQQAAEKAIKAVFVIRALEFRLVHDLAVLLDALRESGLLIPAEIFEAHFLTPYAVEIRYPGLDEELGADETREALRAAETVLNWAKDVVRTENGAK